MTVICSACQTDQFLQIVESRIYFEDAEDSGSLREVYERYECTMCNRKGEFSFEDSQPSISGDVSILDERPRVSL